MLKIVVFKRRHHTVFLISKCYFTTNLDLVSRFSTRSNNLINVAYWDFIV